MLCSLSNSDWVLCVVFVLFTVYTQLLHLCCVEQSSSTRALRTAGPMRTWHDLTWLHVTSHDLTDPCGSFHVISVSSSLCADGAFYHRKASRGRCIPEYGECLYDYWRRVQIPREWNFDPGRVCGGRRSVSRMKSSKVHRDVTILTDMQIESSQSIKLYSLAVGTWLHSLHQSGHFASSLFTCQRGMIACQTTGHENIHNFDSALRLFPREKELCTDPLFHVGVTVDCRF